MFTFYDLTLLIINTQLLINGTSSMQTVYTEHINILHIGTENRGSVDFRCVNIHIIYFTFAGITT